MHLVRAFTAEDAEGRGGLQAGLYRLGTMPSIRGVRDLLPFSAFSRIISLRARRPSPPSTPWTARMTLSRRSATALAALCSLLLGYPTARAQRARAINPVADSTRALVAR